jgi:hypothetical protein
LHYSLCAVLLLHEEDWTIVSALGRLNDAQSQPFTNLVLKIPVMGFRDLELFHVDGLLRFHKQLMKEGVAVTNFIFVETENTSVLSQ